jgi:hypothetical protein
MDTEPASGPPPSSGYDTHRLDAHPDAELIDGLEPDQLVVAASRPLPPMVLGRAGQIAFWALRLFVLLIGALVVYSFVRSLVGAQE